MRLDFVKMSGAGNDFIVADNRDDVVAYLRTRVTNGAAEAINGIIQTVKRKARGFRSVEYFSTIIYLVAPILSSTSPIPFQRPTQSHLEDGKESHRSANSWTLNHGC